MSSPYNPLNISDYRPDIDGLRAVAVLSVVIYHAYPGKLVGGFVGVDIFFVISGYLISKMIFQDSKNRDFSFMSFYFRRARRILPSFLILVSSLLIFGWFGLLATDYESLGKHAFSGAAFISNLTLWSEEAGYFFERGEFKPLLHLWSLGVEEQFYIIWPVTCWILYPRSRHITITLVILCLISFIVNIYIACTDAKAAFYSPINRFWELLAGGGLAWYHHQPHAGIDRLLSRWRDDLSLIGAVMLVVSLLLINPDRRFPGWWVLLPVTGTVLIILSGRNAWFNRTILSNRLAVWFGLISYPLYLWHWPLISINWIAEGARPSILVRACALLASIPLAWLTWRFIERPVRAYQGQHLMKILIGLHLVVAIAGAVIWHLDGISSRRAVTNSGISPEVNAQFTGDLWQYTSNQTCLNEYPRPEASSYRWRFCMKSSAEPASVMLIGTSFANQLYPGFVKNPRLKQHVFLNISACDFGVDYDIIPDDLHPCVGLRSRQEFDFLAAAINHEKTIRFAVIDGLRLNPDADYIAILKRRINFLESKNIRVIIFTPHLRPGFSPVTCFSTALRHTARDCTFPATAREDMLRTFQPLMDSISVSNPRVLFFEQNAIYCPGGDLCSFVSGGMPLHRDAEHISEYASQQLQAYFMEWAQANVPEILAPRE